MQGCLRLRQENKEFRVKIVWFGFGVSERGSKLKTTLHGDLIFNGWQLCNRGGMPPVGEIRTISDTINTMSQSRSSVVSFNFFLCLLTVWIIELKYENILNIQVSKGCGKRQEFESEFGTKGTFNSRTQCFVTNIYNSTQVCNFGDFLKKNI